MEGLRIAPLPDRPFQSTANTRADIKFKIVDKTRGVNGFEYPDDGGILVYFKGEKYPYKGLKTKEAILYGPIDAVDSVKKVVLSILRISVSRPLIFFIPFLLLLPRKIRGRIIKSVLSGITDISEGILNRYYFEPSKFCDSGREIYRTLEPIVQYYDGLTEDYIHHGGVVHRLRMLICMVWEFDDYYRFAGQDAFGEMDKDLWYKNPIKEIIRILDIVRLRDTMFGQSKKWDLIKRTIKVGSWLFKKELWTIIEFLRLMDLDKMKMDENDLYHALLFKTYNFKGWSWEIRLNQRRQIDEEWQKQ